MNDTLQIEFLGTGTSTGVPQVKCGCEVCRSSDPHDKRLRQSAIVRYRGKRILIDCGPDFRQQILRASDDDLDALLITHIHYDHVGGMDDLRPYARQSHPFPVFARQDVIDRLRVQLPYCFVEKPYPGVPRFTFTAVGDDETFTCCGITMRTIPVMHFKLPILGYQMGPLAYITDCKTIADIQLEKLKGIPLLVINALRHEEHLSHLTLDEALEVVELVNPGRAVLVHMSHEIGLHREVAARLPEHVTLAHDGLIVNV